ARGVIGLVRVRSRALLGAGAVTVDPDHRAGDRDRRRRQVDEAPPDNQRQSSLGLQDDLLPRLQMDLLPRLLRVHRADLYLPLALDGQVPVLADGRPRVVLDADVEVLLAVDEDLLLARGVVEAQLVVARAAPGRVGLDAAHLVVVGVLAAGAAP